MNLFDFFKKRRKHDEESQTVQGLEQVLAENNLRPDEIDIHDRETRRQYIRTCCEQIMESDREFNDLKREYSLATAYLNDIQEVDNLPKNIKVELLDTAKQILTLQEERKSFQTTVSKIPELLYAQVEQNAEDMPRILKSLEEKESYLAQVKGDLSKLEGERAYQIAHKKDLLKSQQNMRGLSVIAFLTLLITFGMLAILSLVYGKSIDAGFQITVFCGSIIAIALFLKMYHNTSQIRKAGLHINRVITLLNGVKIKYVNTTNAVSYLHAKYGVEHSYQLRVLWEQYLSTRQDKLRYIKTADDLEFYNEQLVALLRKFQLYDPTIWIHQAGALTDSKELEELRQKLTKRRIFLRKRMEDDTTNKKEAKDNLKRLLSQYPQCESEIIELTEEIKKAKGQ